jgi:hypothetical protein
MQLFDFSFFLTRALDAVEKAVQQTPPQNFAKQPRESISIQSGGACLYPPLVPLPSQSFLPPLACRPLSPTRIGRLSVPSPIARQSVITLQAFPSLPPAPSKPSPPLPFSSSSPPLVSRNSVPPSSPSIPIKNKSRDKLASPSPSPPSRTGRPLSASLEKFHPSAEDLSVLLTTLIGYVLLLPSPSFLSFPLFTLLPSFQSPQKTPQPLFVPTMTAPSEVYFRFLQPRFFILWRNSFSPYSFSLFPSLTHIRAVVHSKVEQEGMLRYVRSFQTKDYTAPSEENDLITGFCKFYGDKNSVVILLKSLCLVLEGGRRRR